MPCLQRNRRQATRATLTGLFLMTMAAAPLRTGAEQEDGAAKCTPGISTRVATVQDVYHGVAVDDPYRWLEDWSNPDVRTWSDAQSDCARQFLDGLADATRIRQRLEQLLAVARGTTFFSPKFRAGGLFALRSVANVQQPSIVWLSDADAPGAARVVFDPMRFDPSGSTSIDWYVPSDDGALVAVSLSSAGAERGVLHVFDVASGKELSDAPIDNVNNATAGGDLVWSPDGSGFFYTRYPQRGERPDSELAFHQQVYYHKIGTAPTTDRYELGSGLPSIAAIRLRMQKESGRVIAWVQNGDSGTFRFFLRERDGRWRPFGNFSDGHFEAAFGSGDDVFVLTTAAAPRGKVLRLSARDLDFSRAQTVVPESDSALSNSFYSKDSPTIAVSNDVMLLVYQAGGPAQLRLFSTQGRPMPGPVLPAVSSVFSITALAGSDVLFAVESFVGPRRWLRYNLQTKAMNRTLSTQGGAGDWDDAQVTREFAVSRDGTRIPVTIVNLHRAPIRGLLLTGYGGYRISITPRFEPQVRMLLEQGIAYAVANLRGGAEFGEDWHAQGSLLRKQNVFDDFIAVAQHLTDRGIAPAGKLAITGTSNGGLLMGAVLTQRPQLAQAYMEIGRASCRERV